jgi:hypothetical protein
MAGNDPPGRQRGQPTGNDDDESDPQRRRRQQDAQTHEESIQTYADDTSSITSHRFRTMEDYMRDLEDAAERRRVSRHGPADPPPPGSRPVGPSAPGGGRVQFQLPSSAGDNSINTANEPSTPQTLDLSFRRSWYHQNAFYRKIKTRKLGEKKKLQIYQFGSVIFATWFIQRRYTSLAKENPNFSKGLKLEAFAIS